MTAGQVVLCLGLRFAMGESCLKGIQSGRGEALGIPRQSAVEFLSQVEIQQYIKDLRGDFRTSLCTIATQIAVIYNGNSRIRKQEVRDI